MLASIDTMSVGLPLPKPDATGDELFRMGLLYSTGQGGAPLDYVSAHMLFNLAAMRGSVEAKVYRKEIADEMASDDVAEAQRQARQWLAQGCYRRQWQRSAPSRRKLCHSIAANSPSWLARRRSLSACDIRAHQGAYSIVKSKFVRSAV